MVINNNQQYQNYITIGEMISILKEYPHDTQFIRHGDTFVRVTTDDVQKAITTDNTDKHQTFYKHPNVRTFKQQVFDEIRHCPELVKSPGYLLDLMTEHYQIFKMDHAPVDDDDIIRHFKRTVLSMLDSEVQDKCPYIRKDDGRLKINTKKLLLSVDDCVNITLSVIDNAVQDGESYKITKTASYSILNFMKRRTMKYTIKNINPFTK